MITCIDSYYNNTPSLYENMSLDDACMSMILEVNQAIHDFNMDIILDEHVYLYETGTEVAIVDKDGKATNKGHEFIEKVRTLIDKVKYYITGLFNKLIDWIIDKVEEFKRTFAKINASSKIDDFIFNTRAFSTRLNSRIFTIDDKNIWMIVQAGPLAQAISGEGFANYIGGKVYKPNEFFNQTKDKYDTIKSTLFDADQIQKVVNMVNKLVKNLDSEMINKVKKLRDEANKDLDTMKRNITLDNADNIREQLKEVQDVLNSNTYVCRDKIKLISTFTSTAFRVCVKIYKAMDSRNFEKENK